MKGVREHELEDGRAFEWISIAQDARRGHEEDPPEAILIRTAYLMLVRFDFDGERDTSRAIVHDVMTCAGIACECSWRHGYVSVAACFIALYQKISNLRHVRALRFTYVDELDRIKRRSNGRKRGRGRARLGLQRELMRQEETRRKRRFP
jgi:hypothetical protein